MRYLFILTIILSLITPVKTLADEPSAIEIVKMIDRLYRSSTSHQEMEMTIVTPNWERRLTFELWSEGMEKTFIYITSPEKDSGITTLRAGREMWNFFPKINKVMKVPPSMMMGSWMGSDFTNDDLAKESSYEKDYTYKKLSPKDASADNYYIELTPLPTAPIVWGRIVAVVRKSDLLPVVEEFYDEHGRKMRVIEFKDIRDFSGRRLPAIMELHNIAREGNKTIIRIISGEFDKRLDSEIFSLRNLQRQRR